MDTETYDDNVQVCANGGLVLIAEPLVYILVHKRGLSDSNIQAIGGVSDMEAGWKSKRVPAITQNDNLKV